VSDDEAADGEVVDEVAKLVEEATARGIPYVINSLRSAASHSRGFLVAVDTRLDSQQNWAQMEAAANALEEALADEDFEVWLASGITAGWVGPPVCYVHDGLPTSEEEDPDANPLWDEEQCIHILRLYPDDETKAAVEAHHAPSVWRKRR
jgi:hypothetical protein